MLDANVKHSLVCAWAATRIFIGQWRRLRRSTAGYSGRGPRATLRALSWLLRQSVCELSRYGSVGSNGSAFKDGTDAMIVYNWTCLLYLQYKTTIITTSDLTNHNTTNTNHSWVLWGMVPTLSQTLNVVNPTLVIGGKVFPNSLGEPKG